MKHGKYLLLILLLTSCVTERNAANKSPFCSSMQHAHERFSGLNIILNGTIHGEYIQLFDCSSVVLGVNFSKNEILNKKMSELQQRIILNRNNLGPPIKMAVSGVYDGTAGPKYPAGIVTIDKIISYE